MEVHSLQLYILTLVLILLVDGIWLGIITKDYYKKSLKGRLRKDKDWPKIGLFYLVFVIGLVFFVVEPAISEDSLSIALGRGALYGLVTYSTYGLRNAANLKNWPKSLLWSYIGWGVFLSLIVSVLSMSIYGILF